MLMLGGRNLEIRRLNHAHRQECRPEIGSNLDAFMLCDDHGRRPSTSAAFEQHWRPRADAANWVSGHAHTEKPSAYSNLMPANFTTLAHFSVSSATSLVNSAGECISVNAPSSANLAF